MILDYWSTVSQLVKSVWHNCLEANFLPKRHMSNWYNLISIRLLNQWWSVLWVQFHWRQHIFCWNSLKLFDVNSGLNVNLNLSWKTWTTVPFYPLLTLVDSAKKNNKDSVNKLTPRAPKKHDCRNSASLTPRSFEQVKITDDSHVCNIRYLFSWNDKITRSKISKLTF